MARPRKDVPRIGAPRSAWIEARKKDGSVVSFSLRYRDQAGTVHTVETIRTSDRRKAEQRKQEWLAGWADGDRRVVSGTKDAVEQYLQTIHNPASRGASRERIEDFCSHMSWTDCRDWQFSSFAAYLTARMDGVGTKRSATGRRVKRRPWQPSTVKSRRVTIQTWLTWLYNEDICERDIGKDRKGRRWKGPRVADPDVRWITKPNYRRLVAALADPDAHFPLDRSTFGSRAETRRRLHRLEPAVAVASLGARLHDIQELRVARIHRKEGRRRYGTIDLRNLKGSSARVVPVPKDVEEILARHGVFDRAPEAYLMDETFRQRGASRTNYDTVLLRQASEALGVLDNTGRGVTWHTLRRSCGAWMAQDGRSEADIGATLGHEPGSPMPRRYTAAVADDRLAQAQVDSRG